jgi:hypothetical protein
LAGLLPRGGARLWLAVAVAAAGCGDDGGAVPVQGDVPTRPPVPAAGSASKTLLAVKPHVEDRVTCPSPDQPSDPQGGKCDPKAPSCGEHLYCLQLAQGYYCEPCPERDGIRHAFRERDFDPEHNRDPFQPSAGSSGPTAPPGGLTPKCPREDQLVASSYSYAELKLVGIIAQGTQRKVLMTMGKDGYIIKRGDCVGKEKAVVKDIGLGYITFQVDPDEYSVQLNPKQLLVNEPTLRVPPRRTTIAPPPRTPAAGSNAAPSPPGAAPAPPAGAAPGAAPAPPPAEAPAPAARKP